MYIVHLKHGIQLLRLDELHLFTLNKYRKIFIIYECARIFERASKTHEVQIAKP